MQVGFLILVILVGGFVFGNLARLIVPPRVPLTLSETTLVGIAGSGVGAVVMNLSTPDTRPTDFQWWTLLGMLAGTVLVYLIVTFLMSRFSSRGQAVVSPVGDLVARGESHVVEFKQTARWNVHTQERDSRLELVIAKTVAGFLNADGGTLLIGIDDTGTPTGLDADLTLMKEPDLDRFELWLTDHLERCLGKPALASVRVSFELLSGNDLCRVDLSPAPEAVFLDEPGGGRDADMYVRMGNSTRRLLTDEAIEYSTHHWKRRQRRTG